MQADFLFAAAYAVIDRHQLARFHIELFFLVHRPFVVAVAAQGITLVFFFQGRFAEGNHLSHERRAKRLE